MTASHDADSANLLERLRKPFGHYDCDDCWYSCPKSEGGCCDDAAGSDCNCGADRMTAERAEAADEIERLRAWKAEGLAVLAGWNTTWEAAGRPGRLGQSQSQAVADEIERLRTDLDQAREGWEPGEELDAYMLGVLSRAHHEAANERRPDYMLALEWVMDAWRSVDDPERKRMAIIAQAVSDAIVAEDAARG